MKTKEKTKSVQLSVEGLPRMTRQRHPVWDDLDRIKEKHGAELYESLVRKYGDPFKLKEPRTSKTA